MATPTIALRFRDIVPGIDTIAEHREVLRVAGKVWWGWWKKDFEEDHGELFAKLEGIRNFDILITDPSTDRLFKARVDRWCIGAEVDADRVPEYYRSHIGQVYGWFLLRSLREMPFNKAIADRFIESTLTVLTEEAEGGVRGAARPPLKRRCVLHMSDLHFGADYGFLPQGQVPNIGGNKRTLSEVIRLDLERLRLLDDVALLVITGDFTTRGDWSPATKKQALAEFDELRKILKIDKWQIVAIPGNHDIVRYGPDGKVDAAEIALGNQVTYEHEVPYREFLEELTGRDKSLPLDFIERFELPEVDILFCGLNSCRIVATQWTEYGFVGDKGLDVIRTLENEDVQRPTLKILALHHHLLPVASVDAPSASGVSLSLDACAVLDAAQSAGVHVALHGHQHLPRLAKYQSVPLRLCGSTAPMCILSNGSAGVVAQRRGDERNTYAILKPDQHDVRLWLRELRPDGKAGAELFNDGLDLLPDSP